MTGPSPADASRPVTIYDVAAAAGVAPSTVSRTFSRPGRVGAETAERVRRVAGALGYRAAPLSWPEPSAQTSIIAVLVSDVTNPFYNEIISGAQEAATDADYSIVVANTRESADVERRALERVLPLVDGVLLTTTVMSDSTIRVIARQRPVVVMNRAVSDLPSIVTDSPFGMRRAVEHLAELGHHAITYVAGPEASWTDGVRWRSLREAAKELQLQTRRIGPFRPNMAGGADAAQEVRHQRTTAVITYNDRMAIGLIRELTDLGARIPDDVSVIGFDNIFLAELVTPPLTTVAAPLHVMGTAGAQRLLAILHGAQPQAGDPTVLPTRLVVRGSTAVRGSHPPPR